jgi:hypothetical protein
MTDAEQQLAEEILDVVAGEDIDSILLALAAVITVHMSYVGPNRRKWIARSLMRSVPAWLAQASTFPPIEAD